MKYCLLFVLTILAASADLPPQSPVIGVYTQVDTSDEPSSSNADLTTYIASSYVKFLEMSGAQVVPIFAYSSETALAALLPKLNGVLFPGGGENISINNRWTANADYILKYAMQENRKGNSFPVWGTCLGMQLLAYLTSGYDEKAISPVRGDTGIINPLDFTSNPSYLFDDVNADLRNKISRGQGLFYFNHKYAVTPSYFDNNRDLNGFWTVVATTTTSYNDKFLSVL